MIYSSACEYAIRALARLAQVGRGEFAKLREIAAAEDVPYPFVAKVFQNLVTAGLVRSARGPTGGYALARPPSEVTLYDIKRVIDGVEDLEECAVGLHSCSDDTPCPLHDTWKPIRQQIRAYLERTTLAHMVSALERKRALLAQTESSTSSPRRARPRAGAADAHASSSTRR